LLVDDEVSVQKLLTYPLRKEGYDVVPALDGKEALDRLREDSFDLVVLDVMLPKIDGLDVCRQIRARSTVPIIMLTARAEEIDKVVGLEIGADDYITKPFSRPELLARIEAVLRRGRRETRDTDEGHERLQLDQIEIDVSRREVRIDGEPVHLTTKEFDLLAHMAAHPGRIFTRDQLLARIWGYDYAGDERTVDVHVSWLRGKLRSSNGHNYFRTVRGVGYAFAPKPA
jgi:DNA-binding response OmpR family regulator